jgi:hypothetical protein
MCLFTLIAQLTKVGIGAATSGHDTKVTSAWEGMGLFWWSGLLGPITLSILVLVVITTLYAARREMNDTAIVLGFTAILVTVASYQMGGIADRYFVAPMTLAVIAAILVIRSANIPTGVKRLASIVGLTVLLIPSVKWFSMGWYMTGGPTWAQEVRRVDELCTRSSKADVEIALTPSGTVTLSCNRITRD